MGEEYSLFAIRMIGYVYTGFLVLFVIGFFQTTPPVFVTFTFVLKVVMALFLVYRFNPMFNHHKTFSKLDQEIIMFSAFFILVSSFTDYVNLFLNTAQKIVGNIIH
jgi:hypothetical protein